MVSLPPICQNHTNRFLMFSFSLSLSLSFHPRTSLAVSLLLLVPVFALVTSKEPCKNPQNAPTRRGYRLYGSIYIYIYIYTCRYIYLSILQTTLDRQPFCLFLVIICQLHTNLSHSFQNVLGVCLLWLTHHSSSPCAKLWPLNRWWPGAVQQAQDL